MKLYAVLSAIGLTRALCRSSTAAAEASNPVARVVGLLQGLQTKLTADLRAEQEVFERFQCWYKSIVSSKTASNSAATSRIDSLTAYIADIEAGRIEFTTERADLEKQVATLKQDLETAAALRSNEKADYEAAAQEMNQAVTALTGAIQALESAVAAPSTATAALIISRPELHRALLLGGSSLEASELRLLRRILDNEVPQPDWKKLNRKATFKAKYESQTGGIVSTLTKLKKTFADNLAEAEHKESEAQATYDTLKASKGDMLAKAEKALVDLVEENGARGLSKSEAQAEVDALKAQVEADQGFITETETTYATKKSEWAERQKLRQMELSAISEAISVLHSDEARDTFTKSYKSAAASFLQVASGAGAHSRTARRSAPAMTALRSLALVSRDARVLRLADAALLSGGTRSISAVITKIDELVAALKAEEQEDLTKKESCEKQRADGTRQAKEQSVAIDDITEEIDRSEAKVVELDAQIAEQNATIQQLNGTVVELVRQREDEHARYVTDKADDQAAVALVTQAVAVIEKLQQDMKKSALVQHGHEVHSAVREPADTRQPTELVAVDVRLRSGGGSAAVSTRATSSLRVRRVARSQQPVEVAAGQAPPPPPRTWEDPTYAGATDEQAGISSILTLLKEDLVADIAAADADESKADSEFQAQQADLLAAIQAAKDAISGYESEKATEDQKVVDKTAERTTNHEQLQSTLKQLEGLRAGCDFFIVNFGVRLQSRQVELDGLEKAKAILKGADFA